jgi:nitroimidazol reductase NimA-like FMN-containing flavoprotein (pyridoxamine 5'-phosphate oxidase superfamily)
MRSRPKFTKLTIAQCRELLAANHVGRLAFLRERHVDIEPLGYVSRGSWLFLRSAFGTKFVAFAHSPYVAFEVDEVRGPLDWRSVVVHGTIHILDSEGAPIERKARAKALRAIRTVAPEAMGPMDPTPERQIIYGLHIISMQGRMARSAPAAPRFGQARGSARRARRSSRSKK